MAEPPAPAINRAVATGACSRTTASTMAAPSWDWAPICASSDPTSRAMTMPKGMETRIRGKVVTRARNQHWSKNSATGRPRMGSWRSASRARANMLPVSRMPTLALDGGLERGGAGEMGIGRRPSGATSFVAGIRTSPLRLSPPRSARSTFL